MARQGWGRHSTVATGSDSGDQVSVNAWNADNNKVGMLGFTGETIASATSITPTSTTLILSGSTNVSTITTTNTAEYDLLYIFTSGSVTLVNTSSPSSAGDIKLLANTNTDLSQTVPIILIRKGNFWYEYGGSPVTDESITFAKIQNLATMKVIGRTTASTGVSSEVAILDEDNMASDSATSLSTQQSIKAYVDAQSHSNVTASSTTTFTNKSIDLTDNTLTGTSAELKTAISDETGSGYLVFATSPTLVTPALGTPASGVATNLTGTASNLTAGNATLAAGLSAVLADNRMPDLTGEITNTEGAVATVITDNIVDEANLKVNNSPTDDYVLTALASASGGLTWAAGGGGDEATPVLQAVGYSAANASPSTEGTHKVSVFAKTIDSNNQGLYVRIKKNGAYTDVQIG